MNDERKDFGLSLLRKGKQSFFRMIFSRTGVILLLLAVQVLLLLAIFGWFEEFLPHIYGGVVVFTLLIVLYLLNSDFDPTSKITWLVVVMLLPVFGALLLLFTQAEVGHRTLKKTTARALAESRDLLPQQPEDFLALRQEDPGAASLSRYTARCGAHPVWRNTEVRYFSLGEYMYEEMLVQLEKAEKFIFFEYFIVDEGKMWGRILDILARKAEQGVEVRVLYDGTNELSTLPHDYPRRLEKLGIKCKMFAPVTPFVSTHYNYRDHRKILVIDGHTAFNGGINVADEYINEVVHYGHWKDTGVMLAGDGARSFTLMFLQMWNLDEKKPVYEPYVSVHIAPRPQAAGYVMPYGDCPVDDDKVGEHVYIDLLNRANDYVYIMSPYLILDGELEDALKFAAQRGVDVRIMLPGIADNAFAHGLALTHYKALTEAGVTIMEYVPGYIHAKMFIADGREAVVGTINLDYRSLYHHFECATYLHGCACIPQIREDFLKTQEKCRIMTPELAKAEPVKRKLLGILSKAVAPLL